MNSVLRSNSLAVLCPLVASKATLAFTSALYRLRWTDIVFLLLNTPLDTAILSYRLVQFPGTIILVRSSTNEVIVDELRVFDEKLARLIATGYHPLLDDGIKPNILPLQDMGVLSLKKII